MTFNIIRIHGKGEKSTLMDHHLLYRDLGRTAEERQKVYRELFGHELEQDGVDRIRKATNGNFSLGDRRFTAGISKTLGRRIVPGKAGRPRKQK